QYPKVETYAGYLYIILHDIAFNRRDSSFTTKDVDFFLGPTYLVTIHSGDCPSIGDLREHAPRNPKILGEGSVSLFHRIVDSLVDHYRREMDLLQGRLARMGTRGL